MGANRQKREKETDIEEQHLLKYRHGLSLKL